MACSWLHHVWGVMMSIFMLVSALSIPFESRRARIAIDYGPRAIGVASSDPFGNILPLCTLENDGDLCGISNKILDMTRSAGAIEVIVGFPLDSNGKTSHHVRNFNGQLCLNFSRVLSAYTTTHLPRVSILLFDERYTTREAKARMKSDKVKASLDAMSAACLLERYLEDEGEGALLAIPCSYPPPAELAYFDYNIVRDYIRDRYYSSPMSAGRREELIMQNLKQGKSAYDVRRIYGLAHQRIGNENDVDVDDDVDDDGEGDDEFSSVQGEDDAWDDLMSPSPVVSLPSSNNFQTTTSANSDPSSSITSRSSSSTSRTLSVNGDSYITSNANIGLVDIHKPLTDEDGDDGDDTFTSFRPSDAALSVADLELLEYQKIKASRRKRGTLKRLHKKDKTISSSTEEAKEPYVRRDIEITPEMNDDDADSNNAS